jgi:hypothetical protein
VVDSQIGNKLAATDTAAAKNWSSIFDNLNLSFTFLFTAELFVNLFVNWFTPFIRNGSGPARPARASPEAALDLCR